MANRHPRKRRRQPCAVRWRRLFVEQYEPRTLLASAAPDGVDRTITTLEDTPYVFQASDFPFTDSFESPAPNSLQAVRIASLPLDGWLMFDNQPVVVGQFISVADFNVSQIRFLPAPNANGTAYAKFTFQVQDNGGTVAGGIDLDPTPNTITINVTPVNDPPFGIDSVVSMLEDAYFNFTPTKFGFSDPTDNQANGIASVVITSLPTSGTLRVGNTALTTSNLATAGTIPAGNISQLSFTPASNSNDSNQPFPRFTFRLRDNGGIANGGVDTSVTANTLTISVTSVNDAPFSADRSVTTLEDTAYTFTAADFVFHDFIDFPPNSLKNIQIATLPQRGTLTNDGVTVVPGASIAFSQIALGKLVYSPAANGKGGAYDAFTFRVQDNGGTANGGTDTSLSPSTIAINVTSVNDPPSGSDRSLGVLFFASRTFELSDFGQSDDSDTPQNDLQSVIIRSLPTIGTLLLNGSPFVVGMLPLSVSATAIIAGQFNYQAPPTFAVTSFQFQVQDSGGTANGGIDVDPSPNALSLLTYDLHNTAPDGIHNTVTTAEDVPYAFRLSDFPIFDLDANNLRAVKVTTLPIVGTLLDNGSPVSAGQFVSAYDIGLARFTYAPPANASGSPLATFRFQVQDDGGTVITNGFPGQDLDPIPATMTINVTSVNDPPSGTDNVRAVRDCGAFTFSLSDFGFADQNDWPIPDFFIGIKIAALPSFLPSFGTISVNGISVTPNQFISATDISAGRLKLTLSNMVDGPIGELKFQVQDSGGTANGGADLDPTPNSFFIFAASPPNTIGLFPIDKTFTTNEDQAYVFRVEDFPLNDWYSDSLKSVTFVGASQNGGRLKNNGIDVAANQTIPVADIVAGRLTYSPPPNQAGLGVATLSFRVLGDGGTCATFSATPTDETVTFSATFVNDPPSGKDGTVTALEDTPYVFKETDFALQDINDQPPNTLQSVKITTLPAKGILTADDQLVVIGQFIPVADIRASKLKFTPVVNANGVSYANFTFQVQDDGGTANGGIDLDPTPNTITFNVMPANDPPTFNHLSGDYSATDENPQTHGPASQQCLPGWATDVIPGPADESGQTVSFIVTNRNPNLFAVPPKVNADGSLCYTPRPNAAGTAIIGVALLDNLDGTSPKVSFQIQITKPHPLHNTVNRYDVSGTPLIPNSDVVIAADDALIVINYINASGSGPIPANAPAAPPYPDVNADDSVAADDVMEIINWINSHSELAQSEASGNAVPLASDASATNSPDTVSQPAVNADLLNMLAADAESAQLKRRRLAN